MSPWIPLAVILYLLGGLLIFPPAKLFPKHVGPAKEVMGFIVLFPGPGLGILLALVFWALWPLALVFGLFVPSLTLGQAPDETVPEDVDRELFGTEARCISDLRPSGKIDVNGRPRHATSINAFIPKGSKVKIVKRQGADLVVEKVQ